MWQETYADPGFHRHVRVDTAFYRSRLFTFHFIQVALAKTLGLLTLRLSDSIIVPLNTTEYALQLDSYVDT